MATVITVETADGDPRYLIIDRDRDRLIHITVVEPHAGVSRYAGDDICEVVLTENTQAELRTALAL
jgi:hypothetical protein